MNVALYCPRISQTGGAERTILELSRRSDHQYTLFTHCFDGDRTFPELKRQKITALPKIPAERNFGCVARAMWGVISQSLPDGFDVLLVICEGFGDLIVLRNYRTPVVCVCLTPVRMVFDSAYRDRALMKGSFGERLAIQVARRAYQIVDCLAWQRFERVICVSHEVKKRVLDGRLTRDSCVEVAPLGPRFDVRPGSRVFERYFFVPCTIGDLTNLELVVTAFERFQKQQRGHSEFRMIVAVYTDTSEPEEWKELRNRVEKNPAVEIRVNASEEELEQLYRNCYTVLFTAQNCDLAVVPLEAMSFGKPVIAANSRCARELISDKVDGFLEELSPESFASRMTSLALDPFQAFVIGLEGFKKAQRCSWNQFCARVDQAMESVVFPDPIEHLNGSDISRDDGEPAGYR